MKRFFERRSGHERRDWDVFHYPDRRSGPERRSAKKRRHIDTPDYDPERRRVAEDLIKTPPPQPPPSTPPPEERYYSTIEVAELTGLSQPTLLLWIRNKVIDGSRIKRSVEGRRQWTREDIEEIKRVKARNGWLA